MNKLYMLTLSFFLFTACSSTLLIKNDELSYDNVNQRLEGKSVNVIFNNGEEISTSNINLGLDKSSMDGVNFSTDKIHKITDTNHFIGATIGAVSGTIAGAGFGLIIGWISGIKKSMYQFGGYTASEETAVKGAIIGGLIGFAVGGISGAFGGPKDTYIFIYPEMKDSTFVPERAKQATPFASD